MESHFTLHAKNAERSACKIALHSSVGLALFLSLVCAASWAANVQVSSTNTKNDIAATEKQVAINEHKIIGYYVSWGQYDTFGKFDPLKIKANLYTHVNYAFAAVAENGRVYMPDEGEWDGKTGWGDRANFARMAELKQKNPHLKTLISIGGGVTGSKYFSNAGLTPKSRQLFADSAIAFMRQWGFDGLDVDWEFPSFAVHPYNVWRSEDLNNFPLLFKTLRATLDAASKQDGKRYLLTMASESNPVNLIKYDWKTVASQVDWINVMTYQYSGPWALESGHIAPLYADPISSKPPKYNADGTIQTYLQLGVPANKLVMGLEYSGHIWNGCQTQHQGPLQRLQINWQKHLGLSNRRSARLPRH